MRILSLNVRVWSKLELNDELCLVVLTRIGTVFATVAVYRHDNSDPRFLHFENGEKMGGAFCAVRAWLYGVRHVNVQDSIRYHEAKTASAWRREQGRIWSKGTDVHERSKFHSNTYVMHIWNMTACFRTSQTWWAQGLRHETTAMWQFWFCGLLVF